MFQKILNIHYLAFQISNHLKQLCDEEKLDSSKVEAIIEEYIFSNQIIDLRDKVNKSLLEKQKLLTRRKTISRVIEKINGYLATFFDS